MFSPASFRDAVSVAGAAVSLNQPISRRVDVCRNFESESKCVLTAAKVPTLQSGIEGGWQ